MYLKFLYDAYKNLFDDVSFIIRSEIPEKKRKVMITTFIVIHIHNIFKMFHDRAHFSAIKQRRTADRI